MPDEEPQPVTMYALYMKLGEINGTMKTFVDAQIKINDQLFANDRGHSRSVGSLLQTRRTQKWIIGLVISGWAIFSEAIRSLFPSIHPGP